MRTMCKKICSLAVLAIATLCLLHSSFAQLEEIESAVIQENYKLVQELAQKFLATNSTSSDAHEVKYYYALSYLRLDDYAKARNILEQLLKENLDYGVRDKCYLSLYDTHYMEGDYLQALQVIEKIKKISPRSEFISLVYLRLARVNLKLARWSAAREYLKKIVDGFPNSLEYHIAKQLLQEKQYFAVQVGAFVDRDKAEEVLNELKQKGEYAYVVETLDHRNRQFYRVRVGQLTLLDDAENLKDKLSKEGYPTRIYP